jgi:hypothetical protein
MKTIVSISQKLKKFSVVESYPNQEGGFQLKFTKNGHKKSYFIFNSNGECKALNEQDQYNQVECSEIENACDYLPKN